MLLTQSRSSVRKTKFAAINFSDGYNLHEDLNNEERLLSLHDILALYFVEFPGEQFDMHENEMQEHRGAFGRNIHLHVVDQRLLSAFWQPLTRCL